MSGPHRPIGHPPRRAHASARVLDLLYVLQAIVQRRRRRVSGRFRGPYDWRRLCALGVILTDLAVLTIAKVLLGARLLGYWPGTNAILGGLLLSIIIIRLGSPRLYHDWIAMSLLQVGLGFLLVNDPLLTTVWSFDLFCLLLAIVATLMTWIGKTMDINGGVWLAAGGLTNFNCIAWAIVGRYAAPHVKPDIVLAASMLFLGLSIIGLGFSSRKHP